ncbi:hypothetical protein WICPIJ_008029 [Wickerhamomyces pijperi]|uniref:Cyclin N-terminal domain-containing protein n=1 Tax=Wickerhamomyces pijperi TaxID=599730 RepID=A0A9P8Q189_WICPI|nr:hypothetical protein WICPIJ_008029 [Wickerhamomyces pijperi]
MNTYTATGDEISFMNMDLFIKIAINFTNVSDFHVPMDFTNKLHNLVKLTSLSNITLVQALFYLKTVQGCHNRKEGFNELFRKVSLLLMISNKYLDDYSFNLKTWINLTNLSKEFIVSQEIKLLKMLNYDLNNMFKNSRYNDFVDELKRFTYAPLTPNSPTIEISSIGSLLNYEQSLFTNSYIRQPVQAQSSFTTPPYSNTLVYPYNSYSFDQQTFPDQLNISQYYTGAPSETVSFTQTKKRSYDMLQPSTQYQQYDKASYKARSMTHQGDCECCKLTNAANTYCSSNNQAFNQLIQLPQSLVPCVYYA